ncbi:MAG: hypothetical protein M5U26_17770 [Planctomycetota bacterium]|nr:hypothetical protein [Planctomycetota bacterium]
MRSAPRPRALFSLLSLMLAACAARGVDEPPAAAGPDPAARVPKFALGVLGVARLGPAFEGFSAYCDRIVANSGALAGTTVASTLFPVPSGADGGVKPDAPAALFWVDPALSKRFFEVAAIVPVADAEAFTARLKAAYDAARGDDGLLRWTILQAYDQPDRRFVAKLEGGYAYAAPDEAILAQLLDLAAGKGAEAFVPKSGEDAELVLDVDGLRERYGLLLQQSLYLGAMLGRAMAPQAGDTLDAIRDGLPKVLAQLGALELRSSFKPGEWKLYTRLHAHPGTELAKFWNKKAPKLSPGLTRALPAGTPLFLQFPSHDLAYLDLVLLSVVRSSFALQSPAARAAVGEWRRAAAAFSKAVDRDAALALWPSPERGLRVAAVLGASDPAAAELAAEAYVKALAAVAHEALRAEFRLPPEAPPILELKPAGPDRHGEAALNGLRIEPAAQAQPPLALGPLFDRTLGWPPAIHWTRLAEGVALSFGTEGSATLKECLDRAAGPEAETLAAAPASKADLAGLAEGVDLWARLNLLGLPRDLLKAARPEAPELAVFARELPDPPARLAVETGDLGAALELKLPSESAASLVETYFRLQRRGVNPLALLQSLLRPAAGNVPAPPAASRRVSPRAGGLSRSARALRLRVRPREIPRWPNAAHRSEATRRACTAA